MTIGLISRMFDLIQGTYSSAYLAAGLTLNMIDEVLTGKVIYIPGFLQCFFFV